MDNMVNSMIDKEIKIDINDIQVNPIELTLEDLKPEDLKIDDDPIKIMNEKEYTEIYLKAKQEAEEAKNKAIDAYLKLEEIRLKYNIDESDEENL